MEWLPPDMSELTVVLVGTSWSQRSFVGNLLLKKIMFNPETEPQRSEIHREKKENQTMTVVNTPDLLRSNTTQMIQDIKDMSAPLVFLLVLQPEDLSDQLKSRLQSVLESFGEQAFERALVLLFTGGAEATGSMAEALNCPPLRDLLQLCRSKHLWCKDLKRDTLLKEITAMLNI